MTKGNRRIFFYTLVALFAILAPVIIGYALGYTFDFSEKTVAQTGGIFVKSKTPRLSIFLNSEFIKSTSLISGGALLTDVQPGTYLIRMEKEGYVPWSKTATVESSVVTELRNVLLFPREVKYAAGTTEELALIKRAGAPATLDHAEILARIDARLEIPRPGGRDGGPEDLAKQRIVQNIGTTTKIIASQIHSLAAIGKDVFFVDTNGFMARLSPETTAIQTLGRPGFFLAKPLNFFPSPAGEIAILDASGGLYILDTSDSLLPIGGGVKKIHFDLRGNKALLVKEQTVDVLWLKDNPQQPFQKKGAVENILTLESGISDARWFYADNTHVVIQTNDGIFVTELDGRGGRNTVELITGKTDEILTTPEKPQTIFFKRDGKWFGMEL